MSVEVLPKTTVVIGLGPAGLGTALQLSVNEGRRVVCLEAGEIARDRYCRYLQARLSCLCGPGCETLSGLGGAAGYGGGKVSLPPAGSGFGEIVGDGDAGAEIVLRGLDVLNRFLETSPHPVAAEMRTEAAEYYASKGLSYKHYDVHKFSAGKIRVAFGEMLKLVRASGAEVLSPARVTRVARGSDGFLVCYVHDGARTELHADTLVFSSGRLGRRFVFDQLGALGVHCDLGFADVGVRLEFRTEDSPALEARHGDLKVKIGAARTYCVCTDGFVVPYSLDGVLGCEGVNSDGVPSGFTNFAILLREEGDPSTLVAEVAKRQKAMGVGAVTFEPLEELLSPTGLFRCASVPGGTLECPRTDRLLEVFPERFRSGLRESIRCILDAEGLTGSISRARAYGPELDYALARIPAGSNFELEPGLYVAGEATGRFRGVLQSFASGIYVGDLISGEHAQ